MKLRDLTGTVLGGAAGFMVGGPVGALMGSSLGSGLDAGNMQVGINQQNLEIAREQMAFNKERAQEAMAFSERMSSTAHQRQVMDLRKAGLNPILAAGGKGAASPAGTSASGAGATMVNPTQVALNQLSSAANLSNVLKQGDVLKEQYSKLMADTNLSMKLTQKAGEDTKIAHEEARLRKVMAEAWERMGPEMRQTMIMLQAGGVAGGGLSALKQMMNLFKGK